MKITKTEIAGKLKKLKGLLNNKAAEINGVLVKGNTLYATNLEISIKATLDVPASDESFVIPRGAIDLIENLPNDVIDITSDGKSVSITCGSIKHKVQTVDVSKYPAEQEISSTADDTTISSGEFLDALDSVLYAVSENAKKASLTGVLLDAHGGNLNIVGCDGYRVAWSKIKYDGKFKVIIPKATIRQILAVGISGDISLAWDNNGIKIKSKEYEVYSRIISDEYLKYEELFVDYPNQTIIDRKTLSECLKRALICLDDKANNPICCNFAENSLSVSLFKSSAEYEETVKLETAVDKPLEIGFNGKYLLDAMSSFVAEKVSVKLENPGKPIIFDDGDLQALVLPVKLNK